MPMQSLPIKFSIFQLQVKGDIYVSTLELHIEPAALPG